MKRIRDQIGAEWTRAMRVGDFERAWTQTDALERARRVAERDGKFAWRPDYLLWNGEPLENRRVLVHCNHGLGDTLQFARFLPLLSRRARSVRVLVQPALMELLAGNDHLGLVRDGWNYPGKPEHDVAIEIMELAYAFRVTEATLPRSVPYLFPKIRLDQDSKLVRALGPREPKFRNPEARREPCPPKSKRAGAEFRPPHFGIQGEPLRVALHWASSGWDPSRSIPLEALRSFRALGGVRFFSLQQGPRAGEWSQLPFQIEPLAHLTTGIREAARALLELDLVITVDSMMAHLAGALGRPVWLLLKHDADWRWMQERPDSPWYPTMRLFRQRHPGDWAGMARQVRQALARTNHGRAAHLANHLAADG